MAAHGYPHIVFAKDADTLPREQLRSILGELFPGEGTRIEEGALQVELHLSEYTFTFWYDDEAEGLGGRYAEYAPTLRRRRISRCTTMIDLSGDPDPDGAHRGDADRITRTLAGVEGVYVFSEEAKAFVGMDEADPFEDAPTGPVPVGTGLADAPAEAPEPATTPAAEPIEPIEAPAPEPVEAPLPEPVETPAPEPVEAPPPEPVETPLPEPVETPATTEPVEPVEPVEAPAAAAESPAAGGRPVEPVVVADSVREDESIVVHEPEAAPEPERAHRAAAEERATEPVEPAPAAPAPAEEQRTETETGAAGEEKEKPGFFKRLFGRR